jgi:NAD(P)-dependent dehydrogenase (short-subunit alcohol dehydrogenase family)
MAWVAVERYPENGVRQDDHMSAAWTTDQIPDQTGRTAVVTGANSGLGLVTAEQLARAGATVVLACRNVQKGADAADGIRAVVPEAHLDVVELDLSSLRSVRRFADNLDVAELDLLVNNAGIMMTPQQRTEDGFELQLGTNHLGHFALTGLLLARLDRAEAARVVTLSSLEHKAGHLDFDDLQSEHHYGRRKAYRQSKLANAAFGLELDRRLGAAGSPIASVLAHPGYAATRIQSAGPKAMKALMAVGDQVLAQSAERGAVPTLYAATAPGVEGGEYYGPNGPLEVRGRHPKRARVSREARDPEVGRRLWTVSEQLTGVTYDFGATNR